MYFYRFFEKKKIMRKDFQKTFRYCLRVPLVLRLDSVNLNEKL